MNFARPSPVSLLRLLPLCALLAGCTPMRFSGYTGHDASSLLGTWPIGPGTMAESAHPGGLFTSALALPVYRGWPERHYQVLGSLRFQDPNNNWGYDEGILKDAAAEAKRRGADAIIIRQGAEFGVSQIAGAERSQLSVLFSFQTTALAIRWLTTQEIEERKLMVDQSLARFQAEQAAKGRTAFTNSPNIGVNRTVAQLVFTYLYVTGHDANSEFDEPMTKLLAPSPNDPAGTWIFKATANLSTALSESAGKNSLGLALVSNDGENLTIVSSSGQVELNFNGTLNKGRLSGQLGLGAISTKCEGALTPEKISISFQSLTADGTVNGTVVLQRLPP